MSEHLPTDETDGNDAEPAPARAAGCAGVCTQCAPPGVHTRHREDRRENASNRRIPVRCLGCAGCADPKHYYRVASVRTHAHGRRGKCSAWTLHTLHTCTLGEENRRVTTSRRCSIAQKCAPPGVHTDPPGDAHPNGLTLIGGGARV